jgi:hypothetical protein
MLAFLLELLLQLLVEALFQFVAELLLELGFEAIAHSVRRGRCANPVFAAVGLFIIGGLVGFVTCWVLPNPLNFGIGHFPRPERALTEFVRVLAHPWLQLAHPLFTLMLSISPLLYWRTAFGLFPISRGSVSSSRHLRPERLCAHLGLGGAEKAVIPAFLRLSGVARCSPSRWVWLARCALHAHNPWRRTSGFSGPGLALLAPAADPGR